MERKYLRYIFYIFEIFILNSVNGAPGFDISGAKPLLLAAVFVSISIFESAPVSFAFGVLIGFLIDFSFGRAFGFSFIFLGFFGGFLSFIFERFLRPGLFWAVIFSGLTAGALLAGDVSFYILKGFSGAGIIAKNYFKMAILTSFCSVFVYFLNKIILHFTKENLNERQIR